MKEEITPLIAAFLLYIKCGETPANAVDLACIDCEPNMLQRNEYMTIQMARSQVYSFLHPEVSQRIKTGAKMLQFWFLNFDALKDGELEEIQKYIDDKDQYFRS